MSLRICLPFLLPFYLASSACDSILNWKISLLCYVSVLSSLMQLFLQSNMPIEVLFNLYTSYMYVVVKRVQTFTVNRFLHCFRTRFGYTRLHTWEKKTNRSTPWRCNEKGKTPEKNAARGATFCHPDCSATTGTLTKMKQSHMTFMAVLMRKYGPSKWFSYLLECYATSDCKMLAFSSSNRISTSPLCRFAFSPIEIRLSPGVLSSQPLLSSNCLS